MLELLRELLHCKPFQPVRIIVKSARRYNVENSDRVATGKSRVYLFLPPRDMFAELSESEIELVYQPRAGLRKSAKGGLIQ